MCYGRRGSMNFRGNGLSDSYLERHVLAVLLATGDK